MLKNSLSRNEGEEQGKTGKFLLEVFQMALMQEQDAGERKREKGRGQDKLPWARHTKDNICPCEFMQFLKLYLLIRINNQKPTEDTNYALFGLWSY